jgi:hypothetical protein
MPKRIQRKRTKDWKMPPNTVYVGRPTRWGNPYRVHEGNRQQAVGLFLQSIMTMPMSLAEVKAELRGKDLACWCRLDQPCHADVLLEIANSETGKG